MTTATSSTLLVLTLVAQANAGFVSEISLSKEIQYKQTSASAVNRLPARAYPYSFAAEVNGNTRPFTETLKPKVTLPGTSKFMALYHEKPALGLDSAKDGGWNFGYVGKEEFDNWGTKTKAELDAAFPSGTYTFTVQGKVVRLSLPNDTYPPAPVVVLKGGRWQDGEYHIAANKALTINSGICPKYGTNLNDYISLDLEDDTSGEELFDDNQIAKKLSGGPTVSKTKSLSRTIPAHSLEAGHTYYLGSSFGAIMSISKVIPKCVSIAFFGTETTVKIVAE
ncbi:MAG: hypothetical protein ABIT37_07485 [Luteolibacter sp.]